jgi:hypothetical protein
MLSEVETSLIIRQSESVVFPRAAGPVQLSLRAAPSLLRKLPPAGGNCVAETEAVGRILPLFRNPRQEFFSGRSRSESGETRRRFFPVKQACGLSKRSFDFAQDDKLVAGKRRGAQVGDDGGLIGCAQVSAAGHAANEMWPLGRRMFCH